MTRMFGRVVSRADARDKRYRMPRAKGVLGNRYWQSKWWGDQGSTPHCVGYTGTHILEASPIRQWLEPSALYRYSQLEDEFPGEDYEGSTIRGLVKCLKSLGIASEYRWGFSIQPIIEHLATRSPVMLGVSWLADMEEADKDGIIHASGEELGGHALLADGVSFTKELVRLKNSWSREWGVNGRAWISFKDLNKLIRNDGEACCLIEQKAAPS